MCQYCKGFMQLKTITPWGVVMRFRNDIFQCLLLNTFITNKQFNPTNIYALEE